MNKCLIYSPDKRFSRMIFLELKPFFKEIGYYKINTAFDPDILYIVHDDGKNDIAKRVLSSGGKCVLICEQTYECDAEENIDVFFERPFSVDDFTERVRSLAGQDPSGGGENIAIRAKAHLSFDRADESFSIQGRRLLLSEKEKRLLKLLYDNRGKIVTNEMIYSSVGEKSSPMGNTAAVYISFLRKKIEKISHIPLIKTVRKTGYMLV